MTTCKANCTTAALAALLFLLSGCKGDAGAPVGEKPDASEETVARSTVERGPLRLTVEIDPKSARLSDEPVLTLVLDYEQGVTVTKPPFGEALGDFLIRDFREPLPETKGDREIVRQIYTLEPTRAGQLTVAPISVTFRDTRPGKDGKQYRVESESLTIEVKTVLGDEAPSLADLRPAAGPVELPETGGPATWWIPSLLVLVAAVVFTLWRRYRRKTAGAPELSAHERAYLELEKLIEDGLAEKDVKLFYVELTGIVRRFIERTTDVRAPEQTTEEFLREISGQQLFSADESARLTDFLESADLVKFAAHRPNKADVEESFRRAKLFVGLEREAEKEVAA